MKTWTDEHGLVHRVSSIYTYCGLRMPSRAAHAAHVVTCFDCCGTVDCGTVDYGKIIDVLSKRGKGA